MIRYHTSGRHLGKGEEARQGVLYIHSGASATFSLTPSYSLLVNTELHLFAFISIVSLVALGITHNMWHAGVSEQGMRFIVVWRAWVHNIA